MATYVYGVAWSASIQDTARDMYQAWGIRHAVNYPLEGPVLGVPHAIHFGPVWFYLLAVPLLISDTWAASTIFAGFLCSLKFALAYDCGRRLLNRDFGVLWASAMALPNWSLFEQLVMFNPNAAPTAILLSLAVFLRGAEGSRPVVWSAALGLSLGFALHVHPTTVPALLLGPLMLLGIHRRGIALRMPVAVFCVAFLILFTPYIASQIIHGFPDFSGANAYVQGQVRISNLAHWPALFASLFFAGPRTMASAILGLGGAWPAIIAAAVSAIAAGVVIAAIAPAHCAQRLPARALLAALAAYSVAIVMLRPNTPFYFFYALGPLVAAAMALSVWQWHAHRMSAVATVAFVVAAVGLHIIASRDLARMIRSGAGTLPISLLDIKVDPGTAVFTDVWYPSWHRQELARLVCSERHALTLHGHLAYLEDRAVGLDGLFGCGSLAHLTLGGTRGATHLTAMSRVFWQRLGGRPRCWIGSIGLATHARAILPVEGIAIADGNVYFPRPVSQGIARPGHVAFEAQATEAVLVTNTLAGYERLEKLRVRARGTSLQPIAANEVSSLYAAPGPGGSVTWDIQFEATDATAIDIVALEASRERSPVPNCGD